MFNGSEKTGEIILKTILLVDDDRLFRRTLELQLENLGCRILQAANAQDALDLMKRELPDLILLDVVMPGMDGFELCRRIKGDLETHHIPVIHLTALGRDAKERSFASGADDFLDKPINFLELRARIRSHLLIQGLLAEKRREGHLPPPVEWEEGRPHRVLVAEGHPQLREHMLSELRNAGHEVKGVGTLKECMSSLAATLPDLLIVDQDMPDGAGTSFAAQFRAYRRAADLPLLLVCSQKVLQEQSVGLDTGATDYLAKPFQPAELRIRVEVLLRHSTLLMGGQGHASDAARRALKDAASGAWSRPMLEAHLELLCGFCTSRGIPLGLVGARCHRPAPGWGSTKEDLAGAVHHLRGQLAPGEMVARVSDHTFVLVLPGLDAFHLEVRMERLRQCGFNGQFVSLTSLGEPVQAVLGHLAELLKKVSLPAQV